MASLAAPLARQREFLVAVLLLICTRKQSFILEERLRVPVLRRSDCFLNASQRRHWKCAVRGPALVWQAVRHLAAAVTSTGVGTRCQ